MATETVNKTEEWVLGPENTPFFTTTVSDGLVLVAAWDLNPSGLLLPVSQQHTPSLCMVRRSCTESACPS